MSQSQVKVNVQIKRDQQIIQSIQVELDTTTTIAEIFDFIKDSSQLQGNQNQWTCYSQTKGQFILDLSATLGNSLREETLIINVAENARLNLTNTSRGFNQGNSNFQSQPQQQQQQQPQQFAQQAPQFNQIPQQQSAPQNQGETINFSINITDGNNRRTFRSTFKPSNTLNDVAIATQNYCGITSDVATIDLLIFNQPYNNEAKRNQTLLQLQLKNDTTIEAKVRWYGGSK